MWLIQAYSITLRYYLSTKVESLEIFRLYNIVSVFILAILFGSDIIIIGDKPKLRNIFKDLLPLAKDWKTIGGLLGVERHVLDNIRRDEEGVRDCLHAMLSEWLKQVDPQPSWKDIVEAVEQIDSSKAEEIKYHLAVQIDIKVYSHNYCRQQNHFKLKFCANHLNILRCRGPGPYLKFC